MPENYTKEELKQHIINSFPTQAIEIVNIVCTYDIHDFTECAKKRRYWEIKLNFIKNYQDKYKRLPVKAQCCKEKPYETIEECRQQVYQLKAMERECFKRMNTEKLTPIAFITFQSQIQARRLADAWRKNNIFHRYSCAYCSDPHFHFKGHYIDAELAPESNDINWENLAVSTCKRYLYRLITMFIGIIILFITFIIVYFTHE